MVKRSGEKKLVTDKADAYLVSQGFDKSLLTSLHAKARRLLATSLQSELKEFSMLPPHVRRAAEADLIETIEMSLYTCGYSNVSGSLLAGNMEITGCKTAAGREALEGIMTSLREKTKIE